MSTIRDYFFNVKLDKEYKERLIERGEYEGITKEWIDEKLIKDKLRCRRVLKNLKKSRYIYRDVRGNVSGEIVNCGGTYDSNWFKVFFPGEHWTEKEMKEFRNENWVYVKYPAYDCTGDVFTKSISIFNVPSGVVAYIKEGVDC